MEWSFLLKYKKERNVSNILKEYEWNIANQLGGGYRVVWKKREMDGSKGMVKIKGNCFNGSEYSAVAIFLAWERDYCYCEHK